MLNIRRWYYKKKYKDTWYQINWEVDTEKSLSEITIVVFDTETTGLDLKSAEPIALGALKIENYQLKLGTRFYTLIQSTTGVKDSYKVHGISPADLENAPDRQIVCKKFLEYIRGTILCGFFVHIDITMLRKLYENEFGIPFRPPYFDLLDILDVEDRQKNLEALLKKFKLPISTHHNALEDAYMTALILIKLLKEGGFKKVKDLPLRLY